MGEVEEEKIKKREERGEEVPDEVESHARGNRT